MIIPVENRSTEVLTVMLEPTTFTIEILPGQMAEIVMPTLPDHGELQFDYHSDQWLSIWVPPDASIRISKG